MVGRSAPGLWVIPNGLSATSYNGRNCTDCQWGKVILQLYLPLLQQKLHSGEKSNVTSVIMSPTVYPPLLTTAETAWWRKVMQV